MSTLVSELRERQVSDNRVEHREVAWGVLKRGARLLLEYNVRSELITQQIERVAEHLGISLLVVVGYREVTLVTEGDRDQHVHVDELRSNVAVIVDVLRVLDDLCADRIGLDEAARRLDTVEGRAPSHGRWVLSAMFGIAASSLARLLGADPAAKAVVGASSAIGVIARQELARRRVAMVAQPFTAGLIGAVLGSA